MKLGIDLRHPLRKTGEVILVETASGIWEFTLADPAQALVVVSSTDPRLHRPVYAMLLYSESPVNPLQRESHWIGPAMPMVLRFANGNLTTSPVVAASIRGEGWDYDVF